MKQNDVLLSFEDFSWVFDPNEVLHQGSLLLQTAFLLFELDILICVGNNSDKQVHKNDEQHKGTHTEEDKPDDMVWSCLFSI